MTLENVTYILVKGIYFSNRGVEFYFGDFTIAERPLFEVDIPKYKKNIVDVEVKTDQKFIEFKYQRKDQSVQSFLFKNDETEGTIPCC